jgi:hypothetical protein
MDQIASVRGAEEEYGKWWFPLMEEDDGKIIEAPEWDYAKHYERLKRKG